MESKSEASPLAPASIVKPTAEQGHDVLKKALSKLLVDIEPDDICDDLFSAGVISEEIYQVVCDEQKKPKVRIRKLLYSTLQSVKGNYEHFETLLSALEGSKSEAAKGWAIQLKGSVRVMCSDSIDGSELPNIQELRNDLSVLRKGIYRSDDLVEAKFDLMKESITSFVKHCFDTSVPKELVSNQLHKLCYVEMVIPAKLYEWVFALLEDINKTNQSTTGFVIPKEATDPAHVAEKVFSKEIVHNCLLLCRLVTLDDHKKFLYHTHHDFDELSVSRHSELERYLIAKREANKELYIAFLGEPDLKQWQKKYAIISEGIKEQTNRIPVRFFVEQIQDNYKIIFTGFSFGGLLALSLYSSVWNQTCLSINNLLQNTACITFGLPVVQLEAVDKTVESSPEMRENSHIFHVQGDLIPRLLRFDDISGNGVKDHNRLPGKIGAVIVNHLLRYTDAVKCANPISELKAILSDDRLLKLQDTKLSGVYHYIYFDSSGPQITPLAPGRVQDVLQIPSAVELGQIPKGSNITKEHSLEKYSTLLGKTFKPKVEDGDAKRSHATKIVSMLKPDVSSITFSRHGDEIALVLQGQNLWFCSKINIKSKSGSRFIDTLEADATSRSVHFNYTPKNENDLLIDRNAKTVDIVLYSHFAGSINKDRVPAESMGSYNITYRQRQLSMCTPGEVIVLSFLSALLESTSSDVASRRYRTVCQFLEEASTIVPIESIFYAIADATDEIAWKCAEAFMSTAVVIPPSMQLSAGLENACVRLMYGSMIDPAILQRQALQFVSQMSSSMQLSMSPVVDLKFSITGHRSFSEVVKDSGDHQLVHLPLPQHFSSADLDRNAILTKLISLRDEARKLCIKLSEAGTLRVISGRNIEQLFCTRSKRKLQSPIEVLKLGRKKLQNLQSEAENDILQNLADREEAKKFINEEMFSTINKITSNELSICALLLGAFMEQQIRVPLVDSPLETAHILKTTEAPPAVGVWALFSLNMIDFQKMFTTKKGKAMIIKVEKYIKGILAKSTQRPNFQSEELYAGKLQFLLQCLNDSVSCNTSCISYSLEAQLADLCEKRDIKSTTRVKTLVQNWNSYFKENLLYHIMEPFRPLVARWIIWCLNIYRLREELASHTTVGIVGLSNSGKSCLLRTLFKQKATVGPTSRQRTTVSFLYNLEGTVDGLSVIDFPGIDDAQVNSSQLLLTILQLVVFVIDYKRWETEAANKWINFFKSSGLPVLICLTHADKLYASTCIGIGGVEICPKPKARRLIQQELEKVREKLQPLPDWQVGFYSFCQDPDSSLNCEEGRQTLADVGILFCNDVGVWIEKELRDYMKEEVIAERLKRFLESDGHSDSIGDAKETLRLVLSPDKPYLAGLNIFGETKFVLTREGGTFTWDGYGLKITVPPGAISDDVCPVDVKVISTGQYEFPADTELASSLYWFYFPQKLSKNIHVEIQHCCSTKALDQNLTSFIRGICNQSIPYTLRKTEGVFSRNDDKGLVELQSSCLLGIVSSFQPQPSLTLLPSQSKVFPLFCVSKVFVKLFDEDVHKFTIIFMKKLESYELSIGESYIKNGWVKDVEQNFELSGDFISVELMNQLGLEGWICTIKNGQKIRRQSIERGQPDKSSPYCTMEFRWSKEDKPPLIQCPIVIKGAVDSHQLKITLPITATVKRETEVVHVADDYPFKACNAVKLLRDAGFDFFSSFYTLLLELEVETDEKEKLTNQAHIHDHAYCVERAVNWWITNKSNASWDLFIGVVKKCEPNTADKVKKMLTSCTS